MHKIEVLEKVKENIQNNGFIRTRYISDGCYCAVGYVLKEIGASDKMLEALGGWRITVMLSEGQLNDASPICAHTKALIDSAGFTVAEMGILQSANDGARNTEAILNSLDSMIESMQED